MSIDKQTLNEVLSKLIEAYKPLKIILFGSYAWGTPSTDSDIDLIIITEDIKEKHSKRPLLAYKILREFKISKDIIVYTEKEFLELSNHESSLCFKAKNYGRILYDKVA